MNPKRGIAQIIAGGGALAAAYEIHEGFFEEHLFIFAVGHTVMVVVSILMFLRAWREIEESDGPLRFARIWYVLSDIVVIVGLMASLASQCTYRCVVLPDREWPQLLDSSSAVSMHLQVRGAP